MIQHISKQNSDIPLQGHPPLALDLYSRESGASPTTCWRYRKRGWLKTVNIAGRHYVTREAIAEFNERAARGDFAGKVQNPSAARGRQVVPIDAHKQKKSPVPASKPDNYFRREYRQSKQKHKKAQKNHAN